jgi:hypothetical protein
MWRASTEWAASHCARFLSLAIKETMIIDRPRRFASNAFILIEWHLKAGSQGSMPMPADPTHAVFQLATSNLVRSLIDTGADCCTR